MLPRTALLVLLLSACGSATPEPASAPKRHRLTHAFALYRVDTEHDFGALAPPAPIELAHDDGTYLRMPAPADLETLRSFAATLAVPPGDVMLFSSTPTAARTYLVQSAPVLEDGAVVDASATTRGGVAGVRVVLQPDAYDLWRATSHTVLMVGSEIEPATLQVIEAGDEQLQEGPDGRMHTWSCAERAAFLPLTARDGETAEARATRLAAELPHSATPPQCGPTDRP